MAATASPKPSGASIRPGALIRLRRRIWRVDEVAGDIMAATPIDDFAAARQRFHLPSERPEPAALADPSLDALGDYRLQKLLLQAVRLDALHGTAPFLSLQRTGIVPVEYQLVPLVMALRQEPVRLLLADAVGLGKTIEAGLVISELLARGRARRVLIVTPAALREQWEEQLRSLFYLNFTVISGERRKSLERAMPPGADPWVYHDRLIVSFDYAKEPHIKAEITKAQARWDLVVVDEAHNAAMPHQGSGRKADMERWELVRQIAGRATRHLLLLTATPHNGYTDSFASLLEMLSPQLVSGTGAELKPVREVAARHVCQRTRNDVREWFQTAGVRYPFPERDTGPETEVAVTLDKSYLHVLQRLDQILALLPGVRLPG